jgi:hypothetical protein
MVVIEGQRACARHPSSRVKMWETMCMLSFEFFHHDKWTLLLAIRGDFFFGLLCGVGRMDLCTNVFNASE